MNMVNYRLWCDSSLVHGTTGATSYVEIERYQEREEEAAADEPEREESGQARQEERLILSRPDLALRHPTTRGSRRTCTDTENVVPSPPLR